MTDWLIERIVNWAPKDRRRAAVLVLVWSVILMIVNVTLYVVGIVDQRALILITLVLSWLAITLTAIDVIATTDVREEATQ